MKYLLLLVAVISLNVPAIAGEGGKGGGSTSPASPATSSEIISIIANVKTPLRYALKKIEGQFSFAMVGKKKDYAKLLYAPDKRWKDIYQLIENLTFVPKVEGLCEDKINHNEGKDGSAFNANPNEICLSVDGILQKVNYDNAFAKTVALAAHEVVHRKLGTTDDIEAFAKSVQLTIETNLVQQPYYPDSPNMAEQLDREYLKYRFQDFDNLPRFNGEAKCVYLGTFSWSYDIIWDALSKDNGLALLSNTQKIFYISSIQFRSNLLDLYCASDSFIASDKDATNYVNLVFPNGDDTTIREAKVRMAAASGGNPSSVLESGAPIHRVHYHNDAGLDLELGRLKGELLDFQKLIQHEEKLVNWEKSQAKITEKVALAARTPVENARAAKARSEALEAAPQGCRTASQFLKDAYLVRSNAVSDFDAKSFAIAMAYNFHLDKVIVEAVVDHMGFWGIEKHSARIMYSVIQNGIRYTTETVVNYYNDAKVGQIVNIDVGPGQNWVGRSDHPWWDANNNYYDPHIDRASDAPNRPYTLQTQHIRKNLEGNAAQLVCDNLKDAK